MIVKWRFNLILNKAVLASGRAFGRQLVDDAPLSRTDYASLIRNDGTP